MEPLRRSVGGAAGLTSGLPVTLVSLDATNKVKVTREFAAAFKSAATTPAAKFVDQIFDKNGWFIDSGEYYFWDPLAAAVASDESLCTYETATIDVDADYIPVPNVNYAFPLYSKMTRDGVARRHFNLETAGRTRICSGKTCKADVKPVRFCAVPDAERFVAHFIATINAPR